MATGISVTRSLARGVDKGLLLELLHIVETEVRETKNPFFCRCDLYNLELRLTNEILKRWDGAS